MENITEASKFDTEFQMWYNIQVAAKKAIA